MAEKVPAIFQATFIEDGFIARNDVLIYDKEHDQWDLCEIKATNSIKEGSKERDHIIDIAFQASVLRRADVPIGKYLHMRLNKDYIRAGDLDIQVFYTKHSSLGEGFEICSSVIPGDLPKSKMI